MKINFKELNKEEYEAICNEANVPLTQYFFYGEWQREVGKKVWRYGIEEAGNVVGFFQVIKYQTSFGKSYLYVPHGPVFLGEVSEELISEFKKFCNELLNKEDSIFLRLDPTWTLGVQVKELSLGHRVSKFMYDGSFQPKYEWILDLLQSEEDILAGMKKVNRYSVRQAEKLGVEVEILDKDFSKYLDKFYELIEATAVRDGFSHNMKDYYKKIFDQCEQNGNAFMEIARFNGQVMLVNFFVIYNNTAFFLFSGSENENRKIGYTYLAQWEAMNYAKRRRLKNYNFGAVIPEGNKYPFYDNWRGFSDFKKRFGGSMVEYSDYYDFIHNKFWYTLFALRRLLTLLQRKFGR
ncbi:MAG: peptidoglycan bridge formation glycyltransferase FemA/FemB family protein [bacterium]|nr:peptidoglycan bridge formation glycyltransferase FemA/FemB family protein [bacterium]